MPKFRSLRDSFDDQLPIPSPRGSGVGRDFLAGLQERNQRNLIEVLKAAEPVIEEIAKVKPESWRNMRGLFTALEGTFGVSQIGGAILRPQQMLQNQFMNTMEGVLAPVMVGINQISNQVESFAMQNQRGAAIGGAIGFVAGYVLPGGPLLWGMIGGFAGASVEAKFKEGGLPSYLDPFSRGGGGDPLFGGDVQVSAAEGPIVPIPQFATTFAGGQFNDPTSPLSARAQRRMSRFG